MNSANSQEPKEDPKAVADFNSAGVQQNNGYYDRAAEKWTKFLKDHPNYKRIDEVHFFLGTCQLHLKKHEDAIKTFQGMTEKFPKFPQIDQVKYNLGLARFGIATASQKPDDYKAAAAIFADLLQKHADSPFAPQAAYLRGDSLFAAKDIPGAIEAYRLLVTRFPENRLAADGFYYLGVTLQEEQKQFAEAAAAYDEFLKKPAFAQHELAGEVRLRHGVCLFELKKFPEAEQRFAEVAKIKDFPLADFALLRQAQCQLEAKKHAEAAALFGSLLKDFPQSQYRAAAQIAAGKCYFDADKFAEAQQALTAAAAIKEAKPDEQAEAAYWLGKAIVKQNKPEDALKVIEPAAQQFAAGRFGPFLLCARADALYDIPARRKESAAVYKEFLQKHPQHELAPQALYMAAFAALNENDLPGARQQAEAFLSNAAYAQHELRPAVLFVAAEGYLLDGGQTNAERRQQAETLYRQLVEKHPQHERASRSLLRIGWCMLESGKREEAIKYLGGNLASLKLPEQQAEARLLSGRAHARLDRPQEALAEFEQARTAAPNWDRSDELLFDAGQALRALKNPDEAQKRFTQIISQFTKSPLVPQAIYELGEIAHERKQYDEAIARFGELIAKFDKSGLVPLARYSLAAAYSAKNEPAKALPVLDQLLAGTSNDQLRADGHLLRGQIRQQLEQWEPAIADLNAYLATNLPTADAQEQQRRNDAKLSAQLDVAACQIGAKKPQDAITTLQAILTAKPDYAKADRVRYELGHALLAVEKPTEAAAAFEALATNHPQSPHAPEAQFHIGRRHEDAAAKIEDKAKKAESLAAAEKAYAAGLATAKLKELREKLQFKLALMQSQQEKFADAAKTLKAQLQEFPQGDLTGAAKFLAGECLFREGNFAEALPLYEQVAAAKVEMYQDQALYRAGECAANLKNWPTSQKHYDALIKQFPEFAELASAQYGLAYALWSQNQLDAAAPLFQEVRRELNETGAKANFMLGEIAFARKQYDQAIEHFLELDANYRAYKHWHGMAVWETARCLAEQQKKEQAITKLEAMLKDHPQHERAADATKLLADLKK
jgi:TolA-binding protein